MTCIMKLLLYVFIMFVIMKFRTATCARNQELQPLSDRTLNGRLQLVHMNLSTSCLHDFSLYLQQLEEGAAWALNMFDSSAKPESGVLKGGRTFLGFYSQCIDALPAKAPALGTRNNSTMEPDFSSIYCLSTLRLTSEHGIIHKTHQRPLCDHLVGVDLTFAVCAPSTCNDEDVGKIAALSIREYGCTANVTSTVCRLPRQPFFKDGPAIAVVFVLAILAAVVLGATLFDYKRRNAVAKCANTPVSVDACNSENSVLRSGPPDPKTVNITDNVILCFSLLNNGEKVFGADSPQSSSIRILHGLRFFSMAWVICLHNWTHSAEMSIYRNLDLEDPEIVNFKTAFAIRGVLAIDTFFFMGGLVLAYSTLRQLRKNDGKKNWLLFYVHRYLRTVPMVMVVVAICVFLMRHFGDGPRWADLIAKYETNCRLTWWTYLLYVQNFVFLDHECLGHTWYSAADFQMYLISPPLLYAVYKKPRMGVAIAGVLAIASTILAATYTSLMKIRFPDKPFDFTDDVYKKPYFRLFPFLLGMLVGNFLSDGHKTLSPPRKVFVYLGWFSCGFCLLFPMFGEWICDVSAPTPWYGTFMAVSSSMWALGIAWIVYACVTGCGGIFNTVLTSQALQPLSKLTFSTYIIHSPAVRIFLGNLQQSFYYSDYLSSYFFAGNLLLSYAVSVIFCLFIELPIFNMERLILPNK